MPALSTSNFTLPAPKWFRITKKIVNNVTNVTLAILAVKGFADSSPTLLIIKLIQSFVMDTLDSFMANGQVYSDNTDYKLPDAPAKN